MKKHNSLFYRYFICVHEYTGGARVVYDRKGRKRHARICTKCGKRNYIY